MIEAGISWFVVSRQAPAPSATYQLQRRTWPTGNGIARCEKVSYALVGGEELSDAASWPQASLAEPQRDDLLALCRWFIQGTISAISWQESHARRPCLEIEPQALDSQDQALSSG